MIAIASATLIDIRQLESFRCIARLFPISLLNNTHGDQSPAVRFLNQCPTNHLTAVPWFELGPHAP